MPIYMSHMNSLALTMRSGTLYTDVNNNNDANDDVGQQCHCQIAYTELAT